MFTENQFIEHRKTPRKLLKAIKQAEKVSLVNGAGKNSNILLYGETKKSEKYLWKKNVKNIWIKKK